MDPEEYVYDKELNRAWNGDAIKWETNKEEALRQCNINRDCIAQRRLNIEGQDILMKS